MICADCAKIRADLADSLLKAHALTAATIAAQGVALMARKALGAEPEKDAHEQPERPD